MTDCDWREHMAVAHDMLLEQGFVLREVPSEEPTVKLLQWQFTTSGANAEARWEGGYFAEYPAAPCLTHGWDICECNDGYTIAEIAAGRS